MANRRSKAEIEAEKRAKAERKVELARKRAEKEAKAKARAEKKAEREKKAVEKAQAAAAKLKAKEDDAKTQAFIDKLKIDTKKYCEALPMTLKEKDLCKKILMDPNLSLSLCHQTHGQHSFNFLEWKGDEYVISIDSTYYFYNKANNMGINFGSVFDTWLNTSKRTPWEGLVNIK